MKSTRSLTHSLFVVLLLSAPAPDILHANELEITQPELEITEPKEPDVLHLGGKLSIKATNTVAESIRAELKRPGSSGKLRLFLGDVEVKKLAQSSLEVGAPEKTLADLQTVFDAKSAVATSSKTEAATAEATAAASKTKAEASKTKAEASKTKAEASKTKAETSKKEADASKTQADITKADADVAKQKADATKAETDAATAKDDAAKAETDAAKAKDDATKAETDATKAAELTAKAQLAAKELVDAKPPLDEAKTVTLHFIVERNSEDDDARAAWDTILRQVNLGLTDKAATELSVALAVGEQSPLHAGTVLFFVSSWVWAGNLFGGLAFLLGMLMLMFRSSLIRDDGDTAKPYSLGRLQMAFWGIVVLSCWVGVSVASGRMEHIPLQTLALVGISAATGIGAMLIGNGTTVGQTKDFWTDICVGDNGPSFQRVQIVCWTAVLGIFFAINVFATLSMPEFSSTLLLLMGLSSATYLGSKPQENNAPPKTLDISDFAITADKLTATIVGGTEPYAYTIEGGDIIGITASQASGTLAKVGPLSLTVTKPTAAGTVTLKVTDKLAATKSVPKTVPKP